MPLLPKRQTFSTFHRADLFHNQNTLQTDMGRGMSACYCLTQVVLLGNPVRLLWSESS